jgi:hypothetical protein
MSESKQMAERHPFIRLARRFKKQIGVPLPGWNEFELYDQFTDWNETTWPNFVKPISSRRIEIWFLWRLLSIHNGKIKGDRLRHDMAKEMVGRFMKHNKDLLADLVLAYEVRS